MDGRVDQWEAVEKRREVLIEVYGSVVDGVREHGGRSVGAADVSRGAHKLNASSGASERHETIGGGEVASVVVKDYHGRVGESDALAGADGACSVAQVVEGQGGGVTVGEDRVAVDWGGNGADYASVVIEACDGEEACDDLRDAVAPPAVGVDVVDEAYRLRWEPVVRGVFRERVILALEGVG